MDGKRKSHWLSLIAYTFVAVLAAVAIAAWWPRSAIQNVDAATEVQLLAAADQCSLHSDGFVPKAVWPDAISKLSPKSVHVTKYGVYVKLHSFFVTEDGLFLLPTSSSFQPQERGDPIYRQLRPRVYWYEIKG
ncbi:MAG: hypothetical protein ACR2FY_14930 [Pirellulaceae bacterium]